MSLKSVLPRYALALHTTTPDLGLALGSLDPRGDADRAETDLRRSLVLPLGRSMAATLHQHLQAFLAPLSWHDLAFLAVARGPGSFTGTRLGVVTARTIAQQLELPLFALSTLETLALHYGCNGGSIEMKGGESISIAVSLPAQRGQLFGAMYRCSADSPPEAIEEDQVYEVAVWQTLLEHYAPDRVLTLTTADSIAETVGTLLDLAKRYWHLSDRSLSRPHWLQALPFYGQHPVSLGQ